MYVGTLLNACTCTLQQNDRYYFQKSILEFIVYIYRKILLRKTIILNLLTAKQI